MSFSWNHIDLREVLENAGVPVLSIASDLIKVDAKVKGNWKQVYIPATLTGVQAFIQHGQFVREA